MTAKKTAQKLGKKVRAMRVERDWSQDDLARRLKWKQPNVSDLEAGKHAPSMPTLTKLATVFDVPVAALF